MKNRLYLVLIGVFSFIVVIGVFAGDPSPQDRAQAIGSRIMCPVCQGSAIADSPSETARTMMAKVEELVTDGWTDDQVLVYFRDRYGENIILDPVFGGKTLLVWLLPFAAFGVGAWMIVRRKRTMPSIVKDPS